MACKIQPVQRRFRKMILRLSENFTTANCEKIKYKDFLSPAGDYCTTDGDTATLALRVLSSMEGNGYISPLSVDHLESTLCEIDRHDLLSIVTDYKESKEYKDALKEKKRKGNLDSKKASCDGNKDDVQLRDKMSEQKKRLRDLYTLLITHITGLTLVMEIVGDELDKIGEVEDGEKVEQAMQRFVKVAQDGEDFMENLHKIFRDMGIKPKNRDSSSSDETPAATPTADTNSKLPGDVPTATPAAKQHSLERQHKRKRFSRSKEVSKTRIEDNDEDLTGNTGDNTGDSGIAEWRVPLSAYSPTRSLAEVAEGGEGVSSPTPKPKPVGFKALSMSEQPAIGTTPTPQSPSFLSPLPPIEPLLAPPVEQALQPPQMLPMAPTPNTPAPQRLQSLRMTPFSLKSKVVRVPPLPSSMDMKPVARVKPNLHLSPPSSKDEGPATSPFSATHDEDSEHHKHRREEGWRHSPPPSSTSGHREDRGEHQSRYRHKKKHKKSSSGHRRHTDYEHSSERRREHDYKYRDEGQKRSHHSYHSKSPLGISTGSSSDSDNASYNRSTHRDHQRHSSGGKKRHSSHRHHKHRHRSPSRERWSSEERRRERKRSHSDRHRGGGGERSVSPEERKYKKTNAEIAFLAFFYPPSSSRREREGEGSSRKIYPVSEVEWDSGGLGQQHGEGSWDGTRHSSTVEELTRHSLNKLGSQVRGWDGGENSIDANTMEVGDRKPVRDSWDQELDRGKVKRVKKKINDFSSSRNLFQDHQNKRNKLV